MKLQSQGEADLQRLDFLKFQLDEIDRVAPVQGEDEDQRLSTVDLLMQKTLSGSTMTRRQISTRAMLLRLT